MSDALKQKIQEFVSLAKECPDQLQAVCFELLLEDYLLRVRQDHNPASGRNPPSGVVEPDAGGTPTSKKLRQEDIQESDLHVRARQFLKKTCLSMDHINQLFYKQESNFLPLYDDLLIPTLKMQQTALGAMLGHETQRQRRIA